MDIYRIVPLWFAKTLRRRLFEMVGSQSFSIPCPKEILSCLKEHLPSQGFVIEAGAVDGFFESNTYFLEKFMGWKGILIEPTSMYSRIKFNRTNVLAFQCALVSNDQQGQLVEIDDNHALSSVVNSSATGKRLQVPGRTLASILDDTKTTHVDLLSLDVEGYEPQVLSGLNLDRFRPTFILCECLTDEALARVKLVIGERYELLAKPTYRDYLFRSTQSIV